MLSVAEIKYILSLNWVGIPVKNPLGRNINPMSVTSGLILKLIEPYPPLAATGATLILSTNL